jgi:Tfp pilus assembly protein PilN
MIQFNLLPDVKKEYIKARQTKRRIMTGSFIASAVSIGVVFLLFVTVQVAQKGNISDLTDDIETELSSLQSVPDLNQMLTVQNQLTTLPQLHQDRPETSRLFEYLNQVVPTDVTISSLSLDMATQKMSVTGRAETLAQVNQFADTLKFSTYSIKDQEGELPPFSEVLSRLNRDNKGATYSIDFTFDTMIFNNTMDVELKVPNIVSTRSTSNRSTEDLAPSEDVFDDTPISEEETE